MLHMSSLPSEFGIGDLGPCAYRFVDFLHNTRQRYWQILPLNPTELFFGNCPYSSSSAFAANTLLISPDLLAKEGWLTKKDIQVDQAFPQERVDYAQVFEYKHLLFELAYKKFEKIQHKPASYFEFCEENEYWLDDFASFVVLKEASPRHVWNKWPREIRDREPEALRAFQQRHEKEIEKAKFLQYVFFQQWAQLRDYARQNGVQILGDIPIYVSFDSADVWAHHGIFKLDHHRDPVYVAGVPPDYFSETGQRWGNPVYNWEHLKHTGYAWWMERVKHNLKLFDRVRIDHFRGLVACWEIPASEPTAVKGHWAQGQSRDFLTTLTSQFPDLPIIAEDLGIITPDVVETMTHFGFPGMKVLVFAFNGDMNTHPYLPHNYGNNCVVYTGTHDNNTVRGWFEKEATPAEKDNFVRYIGRPVSLESAPWELIQVALESTADLAIIPLQDVLGLGSDARMNVPGTITGNWQWRYRPELLTPKIIDKLSKLTTKSRRVG